MKKFCYIIPKRIFMPHFFIKSENIEHNKILINDKENFNHITRSLRARTGEKLLFIDEKQIQYETTIENISKNQIVTVIDKSYPSKRFLDFDLFLAQSPLRSDAQNLLIEKATELGVCAVYPIKTDNCALNNEMIDKKTEKWNKIMYESSKQCERAIIPTCFDRTSLEELLNKNHFDKIIAFCERIATNTIHKSFEQKLLHLHLLRLNLCLIVLSLAKYPEHFRRQDIFRYQKNLPDYSKYNHF